jgi:hypothetical protein
VKGAFRVTHAFRSRLSMNFPTPETKWPRESLPGATSISLDPVSLTSAMHPQRLKWNN